jgi:hypothetical protein
LSETTARRGTATATREKDSTATSAEQLAMATRNAKWIKDALSEWAKQQGLRNVTPAKELKGKSGFVVEGSSGPGASRTFLVFKGDTVRRVTRDYNRFDEKWRITRRRQLKVSEATPAAVRKSVQAALTEGG